MENNYNKNVYATTPDARQETVNVPVSRFRPKYRALNDEELKLHNEIKDKAAELEQLFNKVSDGRYKALAFTSLEESVMWIVKELTT